MRYIFYNLFSILPLPHATTKPSKPYLPHPSSLIRLRHKQKHLQERDSPIMGDSCLLRRWSEEVVDIILDSV